MDEETLLYVKGLGAQAIAVELGRFLSSGLLRNPNFKSVNQPYEDIAHSIFKSILRPQHFICLLGL